MHTPGDGSQTMALASEYIDFDAPPLYLVEFNDVTYTEVAFRRVASLSLEVQALALVIICILVLTISLHAQLARIRLHPARIESLA